MYVDILLKMLWKQMVRSRLSRLKSTDVQQMLLKYNWDIGQKTMFDQNIVKLCVQIRFSAFKLREKLHEIA